MDCDAFFQEIKNYLSCKNDAEINDGLGIIQDQLLNLFQLPLNKANSILNKYQETISLLRNTDDDSKAKEIALELFKHVNSISPEILVEIQKTFKKHT